MKPEDLKQNDELASYLKNLLGGDLAAFLVARAEPRAVRVNTLKQPVKQFRRRMRDWQAPFASIPFNDAGFILKEDPLPLSHTLDFFCGLFQYQGIASQIPPLILNPQPGETVLDMAASPGSKATQLAALMQNRGRLFLNDVSLRRLTILNNNVQKSGALNQLVTYLPGERFGNLFPGYFDKILLDAPCTSLGTLPDNPEISHWWTRAKLQKLNDLQKRLFVSAFKALKVGGEMVYSTCSIAPEENELLIDEMLQHYALEILPARLPGLERFSAGLVHHNGRSLNPDLQKALRILPHLHEMEGFFVVRLRKTAAHRRAEAIPQERFNASLPHDHPAVYSDLRQISAEWGIPMDFWPGHRFMRSKARLWILNADITHFPAENCNSGGLLLAEEKRYGWKLFNQSVQILGSRITQKRLALDAPTLTRLFAEGRTRTATIADGYHVLEWEGLPFASVYVHDGEMKLRLSHRFRLVL